MSLQLRALCLFQRRQRRKQQRRKQQQLQQQKLQLLTVPLVPRLHHQRQEQVSNVLSAIR